MKTTPRYVVYREWIFLIVSVVTSLFLMLFNESSFNDTLRSFGLDAFSLINYDYFSFREKRKMNEEIASLKERIVRLQDISRVNEAAIEENHRLRSMLSIDRPDSFDFVYARITGKDPKSSGSVVLINAGTEKGVGQGDAVITSSGLAGIVHSAGDKISMVSLISAYRGKIAVRSEINRAFGILIPEGGTSASVDEIAKSAEVSPGEKIYTADFSELFPPDILIGTVISVSDSSATINKKVRISFSQDPDAIEDVFVMKKAAE